MGHPSTLLDTVQIHIAGDPRLHVSSTASSGSGTGGGQQRTKLQATVLANTRLDELIDDFHNWLNSGPSGRRPDLTKSMSIKVRFIFLLRVPGWN